MNGQVDGKSSVIANHTNALEQIAARVLRALVSGSGSEGYYLSWYERLVGSQDGTPKLTCPQCEHESCLVCGAQPYHVHLTCHEHHQKRRLAGRHSLACHMDPWYSPHELFGKRSDSNTDRHHVSPPACFLHRLESNVQMVYCFGASFCE